MTDLRTAAKQALEALLNFPDDISDEMFASIAALRAALAQQDEPCPNCASLEEQNTELDRKLAELEQAEPTGKQSLQVESVQEPVAWMRPDNRVAEESYSRTQFSRGRDKPPIGTWTPIYTAPPQRKPLTDEEILKAIGWERAEMYMKLTPNFPVAEAKKETLKNARAIERAHGIGEAK